MKGCVIGAGPSGIYTAAYLASSGIDVTLYERSNEILGNYKYAITKSNNLHKMIENNDIKLRLNTDHTKIKDKYDFYVVATGGITRELNIKGSDKCINGMDLIEKYYKDGLSYLGDRVCIVGMGNVALDIARYIVNKCKEVVILSRGSSSEAKFDNYLLREIIDTNIYNISTNAEFDKKQVKMHAENNKNNIFRDNTNNGMLLDNRDNNMIVNSMSKYNIHNFNTASTNSSADACKNNSLKNNNLNYTNDIINYHNDKNSSNKKSIEPDRNIKTLSNKAILRRNAMLKSVQNKSFITRIKDKLFNKKPKLKLLFNAKLEEITSNENLEEFSERTFLNYGKNKIIDKFEDNSHLSKNDKIIDKLKVNSDKLKVKLKINNKPVVELFDKVICSIGFIPNPINIETQKPVFYTGWCVNATGNINSARIAAEECSNKIISKMKKLHL